MPRYMFGSNSHAAQELPHAHVSVCTARLVIHFFIPKHCSVLQSYPFSTVQSCFCRRLCILLQTNPSYCVIHNIYHMFNPNIYSHETFSFLFPCRVKDLQSSTTTWLCIRSSVVESDTLKLHGKLVGLRRNYVVCHYRTLAAPSTKYVPVISDVYTNRSDNV